MCHGGRWGVTHIAIEVRLVSTDARPIFTKVSSYAIISTAVSALVRSVERTATALEVPSTMRGRVDARKMECTAVCLTASEHPSKCSQKEAAVAFNCVLCKMMHHHAPK